MFFEHQSSYYRYCANDTVRDATIIVGMTADSTVTPTIIVSDSVITLAAAGE